jgi:hypothetical protein
MKFHHIGIATDNIDNARIALGVDGAKAVTGKVYDGGQKATLQMLDWYGQKVELVEGEIVQGMIVNSAYKIYHVCFEVDSIIDTVETAKKKGYVDISGIKPAPLFDGRSVVFMMNNDNYIIEFLEAPQKETVKYD